MFHDALVQPANLFAGDIFTHSCPVANLQSAYLVFNYSSPKTNNSGALPGLLGSHEMSSVQAESTSRALTCLSSRRNLKRCKFLPFIALTSFLLKANEIVGGGYNLVFKLCAEQQCLAPPIPKGISMWMASEDIWTHWRAWRVATMTSKSLFFLV